MQGAAATLLLLAGIAYFWHTLNRFAFLPGTDAYYYALQAQSLLETGYLKVPGNGAFYYAVAAIARLGLPVESAFRAALTAVFALALLLLGLHAARLRAQIRPIGAVLIAAAAPVIAFHTVEFPRLTLGLAFIPLWFHLTAGSRSLRGPTPWLVLLGAALLHPLAAALALVFGGLTVITQWLANHRGQLRRAAKVGIFALIAVTSFAALLLSWWPGLPLRLAGFSFGTPGLIALVSDTGLPLDSRATILCFWMALAALSFRFVAHNRGRYRYLPVVALLLPMWPNDSSGLMGPGVRLALASLFITLPLLLAMLNERDPSVAADPQLRARSLKYGMAALALAAIMAFPWRMGNFGGVLMSNDYNQYAKVVAALQQRNIPMLIAHRGLDFYYTYRLRRDAFHFDPEPGWKQADIWRVAARVTPEELAYYSPAECAWGETASLIPGTRLLLVREDCWEKFRARLKPGDNPDLYMEVWQNMENPSRQRPAFLREKYRHLAQGAFPAAPPAGPVRAEAASRKAHPIK